MKSIATILSAVLLAGSAHAATPIPTPRKSRPRMI